MRPKEQIYKNYKEQDFLVWKTLFNRQMKVLEPIVSKEYLKALKKVCFTADRIPDFKEIGDLLKPLTGWSIQTVPNISPQNEFFKFLSQRKFTSTCWLRTMDQLDYLEEPDMFHDVFAHVPLLCNQDYVDFFKGISDIALKHMEDPRAIELLGKIYWFTIEFGLIREDGELKIYGAGIISSMEETKNCISSAACHQQFDIREIFKTDFRTDVIQERYFVINSFRELYECLPELESLLCLELEKQTAIL